MIGQFSLVFAVLAVALVAETASALTPAEPGEFPYQVSVRINGSHACGGAIVERGHIVTSAKCVVDVHSNDEVVVVAGSVSSTDGGVIYKVQKIDAHPDFKREYPGFNDIAVIALDRPIVYDAYKADLFWTSRHTAAGVVANLTGWRWDTYNLPSKSEFLKKIAVKTITTEKCQRYEPTVDVGQLCASVESGRGSCVADIGAPLVYGDELIGVLSEGNPCGSGTPGIFTAVNHHNDFLYEKIHMGDLSKVPIQ